MSDLKDKAQTVRRTLFKTIINGGGGHLPTSLSIVDILTVLYERILEFDPQNPRHPDRDRIILSKGHGGVALYVVLAENGFFDKAHLDTFGKPGTILGGHPDMHKVPGIEASTGALGHGLNFGVGIAMAAKMDKKKYRTFVIVGDGECQEGSIWEAALFAPQHNLDNLTVILDYNKLQAMGRLDEIVKMEPMADKWKAFGWEVKEVDGHDFAALENVLSHLPIRSGKPTFLIAHTVKGKGIKFMEDVPIWHYRMPTPELLCEACADLGLDPNELDILASAKEGAVK